MLDDSSSERPMAAALKDAVLRIFGGLTNEQSQGYLVPFDVQTYPSKQPLQPSEVQPALAQISFGGGTALYDGMAHISSGILSKSKNPNIARRVLIVLSDGNDNYSHISATMMEEAVEREGVSVFSLLQHRPDEIYALKQFANDTGGTAVLYNKIPDSAAALIAAVQGQSVLTIAAPIQPGGRKLHSLSIKTLDKGVHIAAPTHILIP